MCRRSMSFFTDAAEMVVYEWMMWQSSDSLTSQPGIRKINVNFCGLQPSKSGINPSLFGLHLNHDMAETFYSFNVL